LHRVELKFDFIAGLVYQLRDDFMGNKPQPTNDQALVLKYRALLESSSALASHYDLAELFRHLSEQLRLVVDFEAVTITLYDAQTHMMRRYLLESAIPGLADLTSDVAVENSLAGLVWQTQKPYLLNRPEEAAAYPALMKTFQKNNIRSGCALPLTSSGRRLGTIAFASRRDGAYSEEQFDFLQPLANQVAIAVDNALNLEQARKAEHELKRQLEHERLMLEINNAVVSQLDLRKLLQIISPSIRDVIGCDTVGVLLFDQESQQLRAFMSDFPSDHPLAEQGFPIALEGSPSGLAFTTGQPVYVDKPDVDKFDSALAKRVFDEGVQSGVCIPLLAKGEKLGVLGVTSKRENAFSDDDKELLLQIANQVAIAVENALNFERARKAEQEMRRQFERERLMLEINNAVVSQLDLRDLVGVISSCLREALQLDISSVSLYDPKINQLRAYWFDLADVLPPIEEGTPLPLDGNVGGLAFTSGKPIFLNRTDPEKAYSDFDKRLIEAGIRSGGCVPLIVQERKLGILAIGSFREAAFPEADQELLVQIANQIAIAVDNALNFERARKAEQEVKRQFERERLMLEINNAVVTIFDLSELVKTISASLRNILPHEVAGIALYETGSNHLREYSNVAYKDVDIYREGDTIPIEGTPAGQVFLTGQPLLIKQPDLDKYPADLYAQRPVEGSPKSACLVPLISHGQKLGILGVSSTEVEKFTETDLELLSQIAGQVAIAVDNALNFERARQSEQRAINQSEQLKLLLEINNAVVSNLDLKSLLQTISSWLRTLSHYDSMGVALYDPETNQLRTYANPSNHEFLDHGRLIPFEGTIIGTTFTTGQPILLDRLDDPRFNSEFSKRFREAGFKSGGCVPLIAHDRKLGTLGVASYREIHFSQSEVELLCQIANQVAIAVENALNFERACKAERQAGEERDRANLLLDVNNAIISHLDLSELMKTISANLLDILPHDTAGIALYDAEHNHLREYTNVAYAGYDAIPQGEIFPLAGTSVGWVFTSGKPLLLRRPDAQRFPADRKPRPGENTPRSACLVPLISHGRKLGVLGVASYQEDRFTEADLERLAQIAGQVAIAVENALAYQEIETFKNTLASEKLYLEQEIQTEYNFAEIIGQSATLKRILKQVETVAPTDSVVLIQGETGTGKELIARAIHNLSARRERTMVKLNCAAIPTGLLESELFGHEKGAFTGAVSQRVGRFELANKGTLFLDEVGDIPLELQPKLLRVLQESEFERLGSSRTIRADVRLIAATNCDLAQMVEEKKYRGDLFYRLNVFPLRLPPLRERLEDIPLLVGYFIQKHALRMNKRITTVRADDMEALNASQWSGNVRELENFIERAVILSKGHQLEVPLSELKKPGTVQHSDKASATQTKLISLEANERAHIQEILRHTNGVIGGKGGAAEILDLPVSTLRSRMKKLGLM
jgi:formate hydrogenlyase transcriptional activator